MQRLCCLCACQGMTFSQQKLRDLAFSFSQRRKIICVPLKQLKSPQCDGTQSRLISLWIKDPQIFFFCWDRSWVVLSQTEAHASGLKNRMIRHLLRTYSRDRFTSKSRSHDLIHADLYALKTHCVTHFIYTNINQSDYSSNKSWTLIVSSYYYSQSHCRFDELPQYQDEVKDT